MKMPVEIDPDTEHLAIGQIPDKDASFEEVQAAIEGFFYSAGCFWERLEHQGLVSCNGHHMAQELQRQQVEELKKRWVRKRDTS